MGKFEVQFVLNSFKIILGTVVNSLFYNFLQKRLTFISNTEYNIIGDIIIININYQ